ncbi:uncharacterized protein AB675_3015 [Cyphellophora attinorum]|uniref:Xylanolytic transcriptional activator regulatory domain-containing protein n=1 Tax=Cyphellophora attinorum TaxID=1664694 RepID=A0A0N1NZP2_9EURO|nr:uncharacterized protein AB675_3015 [Phialophora attinorum]KPI37930.1 hypothetical protein AB675_3015 [Phialophora attinorum]
MDPFFLYVYRKLKRKCTKELPSCSLCVRLGKTCDYDGAASEMNVDQQVLLDRIRELERQLEAGSGGGTIAEISAFPRQGSSLVNPTYTIHRQGFASNLYFLDPESFGPAGVPATELDPGMPVPEQVRFILGNRAEVETVTESYYDTIDRWFPIVSRKRLVARLTTFEPKTDASVALLLLCMKLVTQILPHDENPRTGLYWICHQFLMQVEGAPLLSLTLLQATALMAIYEIGHGIWPAAILTVGNAVRLGHIMGLHDRDNAHQLFRANSTLTGREEERRTWWGVVVLDRIVTMGTYDGSILTADVRNHELLPCTDSDWDSGNIAPFGHAFASDLTGIQIGHWAQVCQAAHALGCVQRHRVDEGHAKNSRLDEAQQLDRTLVSLAASLLADMKQRGDMAINDPKQTGSRSSVDAIALCCSARFLLYELYACNDGKSNISRVSSFPSGQEAVMQRISLQGINECVNIMHQIALRLLEPQQHSTRQSPESYITYHAGSIFVTHALYWAASECSWIVKEGINAAAARVMGDLVKALHLLNDRWHRAGDYIKLLEREETLSD